MRTAALHFQRCRLAGRFAYVSAHSVASPEPKGDFDSMRRAVAWGLALALIVALTACGFMRWPLTATKVGDSLNAAFGASPRLHWSAPQEGFLFRPAVAKRADRRCTRSMTLMASTSSRRRRRALNLSLIEPSARTVHPDRRRPRQSDASRRHRPSSFCRDDGRIGRPASAARRCSRRWRA